jgi:hypothetical protein
VWLEVFDLLLEASVKNRQAGARYEESNKAQITGSGPIDSAAEEKLIEAGIPEDYVEAVVNGLKVIAAREFLFRERLEESVNHLRAQLREYVGRNA